MDQEAKKTNMIRIRKDNRSMMFSYNQLMINLIGENLTRSKMVLGNIRAKKASNELIDLSKSIDNALKKLIELIKKVTVEDCTQ